MLKIKSFFYSILLFFFLGFGCVVQTTTAQTAISGEIKSLPKGALQLILEEDINRKKKRVIAEIPIDENGRFRFEKELPPHIYSLKINDKKSVMLAVEKNQNIFVTGDAGSNRFQITGSEDTAKLEAYEKFRKESLNRLVVSVRNQIKELKEKGTPENDPKLRGLTLLEIENYEKHKDELIAFIKKEMGTSLAIYPTSIRWSGEKNIPFFIELAKQFEIAHPDTEIAARINEKVKVLSASRIGGQIAEIKMPDKNGEIIALSAIKAKYILIDFWGSWCAPCRGESRALAELYQRFKSRGFEIYGVGLESEKEVWLKAVEQDKRIWTNVSTFQEFETPATFDYAVTSLPANFLVDKTGKVLAKNLHGTALKEKLEKLFSNEKVLKGNADSRKTSAFYAKNRAAR